MKSKSLLSLSESSSLFKVIKIWYFYLPQIVLGLIKFSLPPFEFYEWTTPWNLFNNFSGKMCNCEFIRYHLGCSPPLTRLSEVAFWAVCWSWRTVASWRWWCHLSQLCVRWNHVGNLKSALWDYLNYRNQQIIRALIFPLENWLLNFYQHTTDIKNPG